MSFRLGEEKESITPKVRQLFQELAVYEEEWKGKSLDDFGMALYLEGKVEILENLVVELASTSLELSLELKKKTESLDSGSKQ